MTSLYVCGLGLRFSASSWIGRNFSSLFDRSGDLGHDLDARAVEGRRVGREQLQAGVEHLVGERGVVDDALIDSWTAS